MKALYVIWPDFRTHDHVQAAVDSGAVDTVLMACPSVPANPVHGWYDPYDWHVRHIERYQSYGAQVWPVVQWQRQWTGDEAASFRIGAARQLLRDTGCKAVVWDLEDYTETGTGGKRAQSLLPHDFVQRCETGGVPVIGAMPTPLKSVWFTEDTYYRNKWWSVKWSGIGKKIYPGGFMEYHADPAKYIRKLRRCYGHYWIYSHYILGQRTPSPALGDFIYTDQLPLSWWETL